jgi:hypothetical protein
MELVERFLSSYAAGSITQKFIAPCDLEVQGLLATIGTAPGGTASVVFNLSISPTSQLGLVSAYNAWTTANAPTISGTSTNSFTTSVTSTVVKNIPYALNYPLPGPSGTSGYSTAQSTSQTTETPVTSPPTLSLYQMGALTAPDNTYLDYNGVSQSAGYLHAGDIVTFTVAAGAAGAGSAAGTVEIVLFALKR